VPDGSVAPDAPYLPSSSEPLPLPHPASIDAAFQTHRGPISCLIGMPLLCRQDQGPPGTPRAVVGR
jgi:hypothetical protein